eukprot:6574321-Pyramimonas_sp.AAC.1
MGHAGHAIHLASYPSKRSAMPLLAGNIAFLPWPSRVAQPVDRDKLSARPRQRPSLQRWRFSRPILVKLNKALQS